METIKIPITAISIKAKNGKIVLEQADKKPCFNLMVFGDFYVLRSLNDMYVNGGYTATAIAEDYNEHEVSCFDISKGYEISLTARNGKYISAKLEITEDFYMNKNQIYMGTFSVKSKG